MKKTLNKILGFSLFSLLSCFSLSSFAIDFYSSTGTGHIRCKNSSEPSFSTSTNYPGTGCTASESGSGNRCGFIGTFPRSCGSNTYHKTIPAGTCPANSTFNGTTGKCSPNEGFSAVRTGDMPNSTHGTFSVVTAGNECPTPSTTYNSTTGVCDTSTTPPSAGIMSSAIGISLAAAGGILAAIGVMIGSPVLAAGAAAVAIHGALLGIFGVSSLNANSPQELVNDLKPPIQVTFIPASTIPAKNDGSPPQIVKDSADYKFKPAGGHYTSNDGLTSSWSDDADGTRRLTQTSPQAPSPRVVAEISPDGKQVTTYSQPDSQHTIPTTIKVKTFDDNSTLIGWGANLPTTDTNNNPTTLPVAETYSFDSNGSPTGSQTYHAPNNTNGTPAQVTSGTPLSSVPPSSGSGSGTGNTGTGSSYGGGPCTLPNGQPCASDTTLQQINQSLNAGGENLTKGDTSSISEANAEYTGLLESVMNPIDGITNFVPSILPSAAPVACKPIDLEINFTTGVLSGVSTGKSSIDICNYLEIFRDILSWLFSISTIIYIWRVFTRVNSGGEQ